MARVTGIWLAIASVTAAIPAQASAETALDRREIRQDLTYDVEIRRDDWGVPHILGDTDADAAFGLGYAQSEDDFSTVQEAVFTARGRLAELKGAIAVETDLIVRSQEIAGALRDRYTKDISPQARSILEGYAEGVNRFAHKNPSLVAPGLLPVTGRDLAAYVTHLGFLFSGVNATFSAALRSPIKTASRVDNIAPGSNSIAVAPSRSSDGATRLLVNSHQPFTGPLAWYEAVVQSREGWHVAGGFFPGVPFLLHGHNENLGWASTVNKPDVSDTYALATESSRPNQYRMDGRWRTMDVKATSIKVKNGAGFDTVTRPILRSAHGPVVSNGQNLLAIRYPGMRDLRQAEFFYRLNKARNVSEWRKALEMGAWPSINYTYADRAGNIGYVYNARLPIRREGHDWSGILPGDRSDLIWTKQLAAKHVPQIWNPRSGFVFNSNNTPFQASGSADNILPTDFSATFGIENNMTNRAYRVLETFGDDLSITAEEFDRYKYDLEYSLKSDPMAKIHSVLADPASPEKLQEARSLLRSWNRRTDLDNRGAALAIMTWRKLHLEPGTLPAAALQSAVNYLQLHHGRIDPKWGDVNRLIRGSVDVPVDGGPDIYRSIHGALGSDGRYTAVGGDSYIMFVEWDRNGQLQSQSTHQFGSATADKSSKHYADQVRLFVEHQTKPVLFTEEQLAGHIQKSYRPH